MVKKIKEVDDCLERVKQSKSINTVGDVRDRLRECEKKLKTEPLTSTDYEAYRQTFGNVFNKKQDEILATHSEKGQGYGQIPAHQKSGQKGLYKSQKRHSM